MFPQHLALEIKNLSQEKSDQNILQNISQTCWKKSEKKKRHSRPYQPARGAEKAAEKQLVKLLIIKPAISVWAISMGKGLGCPMFQPLKSFHWNENFILPKLVTKIAFCFTMKLAGWMGVGSWRTCPSWHVMSGSSEIPFWQSLQDFEKPYEADHCLELEDAKKKNVGTTFLFTSMASEKITSQLFPPFWEPPQKKRDSVPLGHLLH